MQLSRRIELYLKRTRTAPARFGRDVLKDPRLVFDLRNGREMSERTRVRISAWLDRHEAGRR